MALQHERDPVEQAGAIVGGDRQQPVAAALVRAQLHGGIDREVPRAPRLAPLDRRGQAVVAAQGLGQLGLYQREDVAIGVHSRRIDDDEIVQRVAVRGGVDPGVQDREVLAVEIAADPGEQLGPVAQVGHDLEAVPGERCPAAHHRDARRHMGMQHPGVPGDVLGFGAQEVADVELLPERRVVGGRDGPEIEQPDRLAAPGIEPLAGGRPFARERAPGQAEEILEQLRLPGIPDLRAGSPDIGHCQQVQQDQAFLGPDQSGEAGDDLGVGEILLLGEHGHRQVLLDEEHDGVGVAAAQAVVPAEAGRIDLAELRVVPAAALGDVVEQGRDHEQPGLLERAGELRAQRVFVGVLRHLEAAQVAHHHQDVLVDGVDVEQVVLHAADDAPPCGQVAPEDRPLVHPPQLVGDAALGGQERQEQLAVGRLAAELGVYAMAREPHRAQGGGGHPGKRRDFLQSVEGAQDGGRLALEEIRIDHFQQAVAITELGIQRQRFAMQAVEDPILEVLHQDRVELGHRLGGPVVALHHPLGSETLAPVVEPQRPRHLRLQVEDEPVLAPPGLDMEHGADAHEHALVDPIEPGLRIGHETVVGKLRLVATDARGPGDPHDHLQVAKAARALLGIGLEAVGRVLVLDVPLDHLQLLGLQERARVHRLVQARIEPLPGGLVAGERTALEQGGAHRDVGLGFGEALVDRAHRMADLQADVPAGTDEARQRGRPRLVGCLVEQDEEIDVRMRIELAPAVASHRDQGRAGGQAGLGPELAQGPVGRPAQRGEKPLGRRAQPKGVDRGLAGVLVVGAQRGDPVPGSGLRGGLSEVAHPGIRRSGAGGPGAPACRETPSGSRSHRGSPARCAPTGPTGCDPWSRWSSRRAGRGSRAGRR